VHPERVRQTKNSLKPNISYELPTQDTRSSSPLGRTQHSEVSERE
jgi:hypothetical protein